LFFCGNWLERGREGFEKHKSIVDLQLKYNRTWLIYSPPNPLPKDIPTSLPTRIPTHSSIISSHGMLMPGLPSRHWSLRVRSYWPERSNPRYSLMYPKLHVGSLNALGIRNLNTCLRPIRVASFPPSMSSRPTSIKV